MKYVGPMDRHIFDGRLASAQRASDVVGEEARGISEREHVSESDRHPLPDCRCGKQLLA